VVGHIRHANRLTASACCAPSNAGQADSNVALLFFYLPILVVLPFLFIAGIFFFVVPGGFIVLFVGAYAVVIAIAQFAAAAVGRALLVARARRARSAPAGAAYTLVPREAVHAEPQRLGVAMHQAGPTR
jgi:hypothetical protein